MPQKYSMIEFEVRVLYGAPHLSTTDPIRKWGFSLEYGGRWIFVGWAEDLVSWIEQKLEYGQ